MQDNIIELFKEGKILARAMDNPDVLKNYRTGEVHYDFSTWANEYEKAEEEGLSSVSTTLLVPEEAIPTYKAIGFLINSDKTDIRHIAETDSGSRGNEKDGDFSANVSDANSLVELQEIIKGKHRNEMNEVNINMREEAFAGLFFNKTDSQKRVAHILLAQKYYELQSGKVLPIYTYDAQMGSLESLDMTLEQKASIIQNCLDSNILKSDCVVYETENDKVGKFSYLEEIKKDMDIRDAMLSSGIEATEESTKASSIYEQLGNIRQMAKEKDDKSNEMESK